MSENVNYQLTLNTVAICQKKKHCLQLHQIRLKAIEM